MKMCGQIIFLILILLNLSCKEEHLVEPTDPNLLKVAGDYKATTFIYPGDDDGPVDVLANGGSIKIKLTTNYSASGRIVIPKHPRLHGECTDTTFIGTFTLKNDSLQFTGMHNVLTNPQLFFIVKEKRLDGQMMSISPLIISLEKRTIAKTSIVFSPSR